MHSARDPYGYFTGVGGMMHMTARVAAANFKALAMLAYPPAALHVVGFVAIDAPLESAVERLLKASRARRGDALAVAGPGAGAAMSALWRRGFARVEAARRVTCACADQLSDVLMVLGAVDADQAGAIVSAVLPILKPEGVLAIDAGGLGVGDRERLCRMLAHRGLRHGAKAAEMTEIVAYRPSVEALSLAS